MEPEYTKEDLLDNWLEYYEEYQEGVYETRFSDEPVFEDEYKIFAIWKSDVQPYIDQLSEDDRKWLIDEIKRLDEECHSSPSL